MRPVKPESRIGWKDVTFAKDQPEYLPLPAITDGTSVETKWKLTWKERFIVLFKGTFYLNLLTFGNPLQPISLSITKLKGELEEVDEASSGNKI